VVYWSTSFGLGIVPRGGGRTVQLNKSEAAFISARPAWSPDGQSILFNGKALDIMTISPEGGSARVLIDRGADAAWSPDGTRIAFVRLEPR
jgi:Tol biopolymer transport system component